MATKVEEGIKNYYILKSKYEKKYNTAIKNIRRSELSLEQKKELKNTVFLHYGCYRLDALL